MKVNWWLALVRIVGPHDPTWEMISLYLEKWRLPSNLFTQPAIHIFISRPPLWSIPNVSVHALPIWYDNLVILIINTYLEERVTYNSSSRLPSGLFSGWNIADGNSVSMIWYMKRGFNSVNSPAKISINTVITYQPSKKQNLPGTLGLLKSNTQSGLRWCRNSTSPSYQEIHLARAPAYIEH